MRASQVMSEDLISISDQATVFEAADLLVNMQVSAMPVVDNSGRMVGIVSEADLMNRPEIGTAPRKSWLLRLLADDSSSAAEFISSNSRRVRDVMTRKVVTIGEDATLSEVADTMLKNNVKRLPVVRGDQVVGIVSRANLLQALMAHDPKAAPVHPTDRELRRTVGKAFENKTWSSAWPTNVVVNAGVVHLWGFVTSDAQRDAYRVAAENVPGVKKVKNHMRRIPSQVMMGV
jgi:CBS domain-containing protein